MTTFGTNLRMLRIAHGMTQRDLAKKIGVSQSEISCYENGRGMPRLAVLYKISYWFRISVEDLVSINDFITVKDSNKIDTAEKIQEWINDNILG